MEYNLADIAEAVADVHPEREVLVAGEARRTFAELDERATRIANHLRAQGIGSGDHVGIHAYNRAEWLEAMLGCYKIRAVPVNVNYRYVEDELRYLFTDADLVALVVERTFLPRVAAIRDDVPKLRHLVVLSDGSEASVDDAVPYEEALQAASAERDFEPRSPDDLYIVYTGGTTGFPKGVMWRQEDVYFALGGGIDPYTGERVTSPQEVVEKAKANETPMTMFPLAPLMHLSGQWGTLSRLFQANRTILYTGRSFDAEDVWRTVEREKVNVVLMSGDAMARPLAEALQGLVGELDLSTLFSVASGAAIFSPSVKQQFCELLPNAVISDAIGSSEGGFNGMQMVQKDATEPGTGVRVTPGPDTTVLDEQTLEPVEPGSGAVGKLARSGNIPLGYYKDEEKTAQTFVEHGGKRWVLPGDYATIEADGTIVLLGRGSTSINTGGEKVYPEEVEAALKSHADVYDAIVVGVPDDRWGQRVAAVVEPRPGAAPSLEALQEHCRTRLAGYKVPRELHLTDDIPRHATGKPDYPRARELAMTAN